MPLLTNHQHLKQQSRKKLDETVETTIKRFLFTIENNNFAMETKTQKLIEEQSNSSLKKLVNLNVTEP